MTEIKLPSKKEITVREAKTVNTDKVRLNQTVDNGTSVIALISFEGSIDAPAKEIILWEGKDYEAIGQWTDSDVEKRLIELL